MPKRVLIIQGHPDDKMPHLGHALAEAYASGVKESGGETRLVTIASLDFPLLRSQREFETGAAPEALRDALAGIAWSEHIVIVFPLWLGGAPALLQAFLEQTMRPGHAFRYLDGGRTEMLLKGRSARLVVTMGMPAFVYRWWFMAHGVRRISRSILGFVGFSPVRETLLGMVGGASEAKRAKWLEAMRALGRRGV
jgi:putative NADPH-quinone reductase